MNTIRRYRTWDLRGLTCEAATFSEDFGPGVCAEPAVVWETDEELCQGYGPYPVCAVHGPAEPEPISDHEGGNGADRTYEPTTARTTTGPAEPEPDLPAPRLEALVRLLLDSGDITPQAARLLRGVAEPEPLMPDLGPTVPEPGA